MRAEVLNEELVEEYIIRLTSCELRSISHNPNKYFNRDHLNTDCKMGELVILGNSLRSSVREVEVKVDSERSAILQDVVVRISDKYISKIHLDYDEANAIGFRTGMRGEILRGRNDIPWI